MSRIKIDAGAIIKISGYVEGDQRFLVCNVDKDHFNLINMKSGWRWVEPVKAEHDDLYLDMFVGDGTPIEDFELIKLGSDRRNR